MDFSCPNCRLAGHIDDAKVPESGLYATCPKCRERFLVKKSPVPEECRAETVSPAADGFADVRVAASSAGGSAADGSPARQRSSERPPDGRSARPAASFGGSDDLIGKNSQKYQKKISSINNIVVVLVALVGIAVLGIVAAIAYHRLTPTGAGNTSKANFDERALYKEAQNYIDSYPGDQAGLSKAEKLLKAIYDKNPHSALAHTGLGRLAYKKGYINTDNFSQESLTKAHSHFATALRIDPEFLDAYYYGTYPYLYEKNFPQAKEMAQKAESIDPKSPKIDLLFGQIARKENDAVEAERRAQRVVETASDKKLAGDAYELLSWVYKVQKQYDRAEKAYQKIIELDPNSPWAKINYSNFLISMERYDEAIDYGKQALALMDFGMGHYVFSQALYGKGVVLYWKDKRPELAKEFFDAAVQHDPDNADAYYGLGMSLYSTGHLNRNVEDIERAQKALSKALQLNPGHRQAREALSRLEMLLAAVKK